MAHLVTAPTSQPGSVVLVTGFEANDQQSSNASAVLLEALNARLPELRHAAGGAEVRTRLMPGNTMALAASLEAAMGKQPRPTHLLLLGQAPGRNRVTLEQFATNLRDFGTPDWHGNLPRGVPVMDGAPAAFYSTWPEQERLVAVLNTAGIPAAMSNDAGNHLCNQLLYLALHAAAGRGQSCVVTFVHVPVLPQQVIGEEPVVIRHPNCPHMPLPMLIEAISNLLRATFSPSCTEGQPHPPAYRAVNQMQPRSR